MPRGVPGPVKKSARKQVSNLPKDENGKIKAGPGRPKGVRNKFSESLKEVILDAFHNAHDEGMFGFLRDAGFDTPTAAMSLIGRMLPLTSDVKIDLKHEVTFKFD